MALSFKESFPFCFGLFLLQELGSIETRSGWVWDGNQAFLSKQEYLCGTVLMSLWYSWTFIEVRANIVNCLFFHPYENDWALFCILSKCLIVWPTTSSLLFHRRSVNLGLKRFGILRHSNTCVVPAGFFMIWKSMLKFTWPSKGRHLLRNSFISQGKSWFSQAV